MTGFKRGELPDSFDITAAPSPFALPGPHPHEAEDARRHGGDDPSLPEGYETGRFDPAPEGETAEDPGTV